MPRTPTLEWIPRELKSNWAHQRGSKYTVCSARRPPSLFWPSRTSRDLVPWSNKQVQLQSLWVLLSRWITSTLCPIKRRLSCFSLTRTWGGDGTIAPPNLRRTQLPPCSRISPRTIVSLAPTTSRIWLPLFLKLPQQASATLRDHSSAWSR